METSAGFDFWTIWNIGKAILEGGSPYVDNSFYPPATSYLFVVFALLPFWTSYAVWFLVNAGILVGLTKRRALGWLLYTPVLFMFAAGQIDLVFLPLIVWLGKEGWKPAMAAALFTLKPQLAIIVLPWFLIQWIGHDRTTLLRFFLLATAMHVAPLVARPTVYSEWFATIGYGVGHKFGGIGVFLLTDHSPAWIVGILVALLLASLISKDEKLARASMLMISPVLAYYDAVLLLDTAPWWLLGPLSLLALVGTHALVGVLPNPWLLFILLPMASISYRLLAHRKSVVLILNDTFH